MNMPWKQIASEYWLPAAIAMWLGGIMFSSRRSGFSRFLAFLGMIVLVWVTFIAWPILKEESVESKDAE